MKRILPLLLLIAAAGFSAAAQRQTMTFKGKPGEVFMLPECAAIIGFEERQITVVHVLPPSARPAAYRAVDMQQGDIIMAVNGTRIKLVKELKEAYEKTAVGQEIQLGIKRGDQLAITAFKKADAKDLPAAKTMTISKDEKGGEIRILPALGILLGEKDGKTIVRDLLPDAETSPGMSDVKKGDILVSLNGTPVTTPERATALYEAVKPDSEIKAVFSREGHETTVTVVKKKEEPRQQIIIRR